jgi:hypothetical protein
MNTKPTEPTATGKAPAKMTSDDVAKMKYLMLSHPTHLRELAAGLRSKPVPVFHELAEVFEACAWRIEAEGARRAMKDEERGDEAK